MARKRMHEPYEAFKLALAGKGIKYEDVAALIGKSVAAVNFKINGWSDFFIGEQRLICESYDIDPSVFFSNYVA